MFATLPWLAAGASCLWATRSTRPAVTPHSLELEEAARLAWIYGVMPLEIVRLRSRTLQMAGPNQLVHDRNPVTARSQRVTNSNSVTLYSTAWLDLRDGPVELEMPASGERYISYAFMDMYGNHFAILGTRTHQGSSERIQIIGPDSSSPNGVGWVRSPTPWVWMLIRIGRRQDAHDLEAARLLQSCIRLSGPRRPIPPPCPAPEAPWMDHLKELQRTIQENPLEQDRPFWEKISRLGLGPKSPWCDWHFSNSDLKTIAKGIARAQERVVDPRPDAQLLRGGWLYPHPDLGDFGQNYDLRARVAHTGLGSLPLREAFYARAVRPGGGFRWPGGQDWFLRFESGQTPPNDAFWCLTVYQTSASPGYLSLVANSLERHSLGSLSGDLCYHSDGSLEILLSPHDPGPERRSNWLPIPPSNSFVLTLRVYHPQPSLLDGSYSLPELRSREESST